MTILRRLLADRRRGARGWALGTIAGVATTVALWPSVKGNTDFERVVEDLPASVRAIIGSQADISLAAAPGYLQARLFSTLLPILLLVYAIGLGAAAIGGAEEDGTLQLVVTAPVSRVRVAVERLAATVLLVFALAAVGLVTTLLLGLPTGLLDDVSAGRLALATLAVVELALLHGTLAFAAGAVTGRRGVAVATASAFAIGGYLLNAVAASAEAIRPARALSPWWWLLDRNLLVQPPTAPPFLLPPALSIGLAALGFVAFNRRDLHLP